MRGQLKSFTSDLDLNPRAETQTQLKPSLGLEPTWLGLKPSQNPAWDLKPTWLGLEPSPNPQCLVSGPNEAWVLDVSSQKEFKDKVIGKIWIYSDSERSALLRQNVGHHRGRVWSQNVLWSVFIGRVISYANEREDSVQFSSVAQSCPTLCDPMDCSTPGLPVQHQLPEFTQTHAHQVSDANHSSHPLSSPSPPLASNLSQHQDPFQ